MCIHSCDINDQQIVRVSPCVHAIEYVCCLYYNIFRSRAIYARRRTRTAHCATPRSARHHDAPRRDQQAARAHAHALAPGGFSSVAPVARRSVVNSICYGLRVRVCDSVLAVRSAIHISTLPSSSSSRRRRSFCRRRRRRRCCSLFVRLSECECVCVCACSYTLCFERENSTNIHTDREIHRNQNRCHEFCVSLGPYANQV